MGIVNVTPDSFSDGGLHATTASAVAHGRLLVADGADILDIGGESTRPGATRPVVAEELHRVVPVIEALARDGATLSVDTMRASVAREAVAAGASIVNDVSGGLADPGMLETVAELGVRYVAMHWRAHSDRMRDFATYDDAPTDVARELSQRVAAARAAGIPDERLILDPGLGFAKKPVHNWQILRNLAPLEDLGFPVLIGASRKSFLGTLLARGGKPRPTGEREFANTALTTWLAERGVWGLRVHDVRAAADALACLEELWTN